jgi:outer membrane protein W
MKKAILLTVIISLVSFLTAEAQLEKGRFFISGSSNLGLDFGSQKEKSNGDEVENSKVSYYDINFTPNGGYTVIDNLVVGGFIDMDLYSSKSKDEDYGYTSKGSTFIIGPMLRYYFDICDKMIPYVAGGVGIGVDNSKSKSNSSDDWSKYNESVFAWWLGGGATYFFNDNIGLDGGIGFYHEAYTHKDDDSGGERSDDKYKYIYNGLGLNLGIVVLLGD